MQKYWFLPIFKTYIKYQIKILQPSFKLLANVEFEVNEKPIYFAGTKYYTGFLICAFENGKIAKISMDTFKTDYNRKKLIKAFNNEFPLVFIELIGRGYRFIFKI